MMHIILSGVTNQFLSFSFPGMLHKIIVSLLGTFTLVTQQPFGVIALWAPRPSPQFMHTIGDQNIEEKAWGHMSSLL